MAALDGGVIYSNEMGSSTSPISVKSLAIHCTMTTVTATNNQAFATSDHNANPGYKGFGGVVYFKA
jgi:hypothetical protein